MPLSYLGPYKGPWSSGYDICLTCRRSPVRIRLGPLQPHSRFLVSVADDRSAECAVEFLQAEGVADLLREPHMLLVVRRHATLEQVRTDLPVQGAEVCRKHAPARAQPHDHQGVASLLLEHGPSSGLPKALAWRFVAFRSVSLMLTVPGTTKRSGPRESIYPIQGVMELWRNLDSQRTKGGKDRSPGEPRRRPRTRRDCSG